MENVKIHTNFGEHLRTLREVASTINFDSSLLAKIERNQRPPTKQLIKNLASFFTQMRENC